MQSKSSGQITPERLMQIAWGYAPPLIIGAAVRYKLFDLLEGGGKTADELAASAKISPRGARMILNALVSFELLSKDAQQRYALVPESRAFLVGTSKGYRGAFFEHVDMQIIPKWLGLADIVRTGRPQGAVDQEDVGSEFFQKLVENIFPMSYAAAQKLADELLKETRGPVKVLDLAAGSGVWGIALAQKSKDVRVTAVDWPGVIPVTRRVAGRFNVADRFSYIEGDLLTVEFGTGYNIATLGHILHSEGEKRSRELLKKTFAALASGGTIAISEFVANDTRTGPPNAMIFAVNMFINTSEGDTFTFEEMSRWLYEAGFKSVRSLEAPAPSPLILATKP